MANKAHGAAQHKDGVERTQFQVLAGLVAAKRTLLCGKKKHDD